MSAALPELIYRPQKDERTELAQQRKEIQRSNDTTFTGNQFQIICMIAKWSTHYATTVSTLQEAKLVKLNRSHQNIFSW